MKVAGRTACDQTLKGLDGVVNPKKGWTACGQTQNGSDGMWSNPEQVGRCVVKPQTGRGYVVKPRTGRTVCGQTPNRPEMACGQTQKRPYSVWSNLEQAGGYVVKSQVGQCRRCSGAVSESPLLSLESSQHCFD